MIYVGMARGDPDERTFAAVRRIRTEQEGMSRLTLSEFKSLVREQYFMLLIDTEAALAAIPDLLPRDAEARHKAFAAIQKVLSARGEITGEAAARLQRVARLFDIDTRPVVIPATGETPERARASSIRKLPRSLRTSS
jgi:hypothetical protein